MQKDHEKALAARDASQKRMQMEHQKTLGARDAAWGHAFQDPCLSTCFLIQSVWCDVALSERQLPATQAQDATWRQFNAGVEAKHEEEVKDGGCGVYAHYKALKPFFSIRYKALQALKSPKTQT